MLVEPAAGDDPRFTVNEKDDAASKCAPEIERASGADFGLLAGIAGIIALGAATFLSLSHARALAATAPPNKPPLVLAEAVAPPPPPVRQAVITAAPSRAMPLVIDNSGGDRGEGIAGADAGASAAGTADGGAQDNALFSLRGAAENRAGAQAERPGDLSHTIIEGTIIPAVLETALNSDIPGLTRAAVSADVKSFDGSEVLIPRGSRLIGQYRATAAPGQSRVYVVWSRLIRPDGVSIDIASPALDHSGAMGLTGAVNHHFMARYGSAILLSAVGAAPAIASGGGGGSSTVVVGLGGAAQGAAAQAAQTNGKILPTIKIAVGAPDRKSVV